MEREEGGEREKKERGRERDPEPWTSVWPQSSEQCYPAPAQPLFGSGTCDSLYVTKHLLLPSPAEGDEAPCGEVPAGN